MNGTIGDIIKFLNDSVKNGTLKSTTATPLKVATRKIFEATSSKDEDWGKVQINTVDLNSRMDIFRKRVGNKYSEKTIKTYNMRYRQAVRLYSESRAKKAKNEGWANTLIHLQKTAEDIKKYVDANGTHEEIMRIAEAQKRMIEKIKLAERDEIIKELESDDFVSKNTIINIPLNDGQKCAHFISPVILTKDERTTMIYELTSLIDYYKKKEKINHDLKTK